MLKIVEKYERHWSKFACKILSFAPSFYKYVIAFFPLKSIRKRGHPKIITLKKHSGSMRFPNDTIHQFVLEKYICENILAWRPCWSRDLEIKEYEISVTLRLINRTLRANTWTHLGLSVLWRSINTGKIRYFQQFAATSIQFRNFTTIASLGFHISIIINSSDILQISEILKLRMNNDFKM